MSFHVSTGCFSVGILAAGSGAAEKLMAGRKKARELAGGFNECFVRSPP
jgi:hypothetical protein